MEENSALFVTKKQCCNNDIIIIVRGSTKSELLFIQKMKKKGSKIVYVLDDDLLNVPFYSKSYNYFYDKEIRKSLVGLINCADILVSPSKRIIKKYGEKRKSVLIKEAVEHYYRQEKIRKDKIRIGFAGSQDRKYEFEKLLSEVLMVIRDRYANTIEIECIGIISEKCRQYIDKIFPYQNRYEDYLKLMEEREWDIGLAPLLSNEFNECKYYNKYIEYGRYGIIGIYSNVYPYSEKISNWFNGILVDNTNEAWINALDSLLHNELETNINETIRNNIYEDISQNYAISCCAEDYYEQIIVKCGYNPSINITMIEFLILKLQMYFSRFLSGVIRKLKIFYYKNKRRY